MPQSVDTAKHGLSRRSIRSSWHHKTFPLWKHSDLSSIINQQLLASIWTAVAAAASIINQQLLASIWTVVAAAASIINRQLLASIWTAVAVAASIINRQLLASIWTAVAVAASIDRRIDEPPIYSVTTKLFSIVLSIAVAVAASIDQSAAPGIDRSVRSSWHRCIER